MVYAEIKIHTGSEIILMKKAAKPYGERFTKNLKALMSNSNDKTSTTSNSQVSQAPQFSQSSQAPQIDIADQIQKLADLKAQGILTEEEFTSQKRKLLGL